MSYAVSAPLQTAVFSALASDITLTSLVDGAVFDAEPTGALPAIYVTLGAETVRTRSDVSGGGAVHDFAISVVTEAAGFAGAKTVAGVISDLLVDADLTLSRGRLVTCRFLKAKAARDDVGTRRRIDLTFRARTDDG